MDTGKALVEAGSWAWDQFGEQVKPGFLAFLRRKWEDAKEDSEKLRYVDKKWNDFNWRQAADRYKRNIQEINGYIRVIGATEPIPIDDIFTDVYILEKPQAYRRFDITKLEELQREPEKLDDKERIRGLKIVVGKSGHRLYILGKPGAGKTTFLKYLVNQTIVAEEIDKLPIFVVLRDWDVRNLKLIDFIAKQFDICRFPDAIPFIEYILESGRVIMLFDGLDEVPQEDNLRDRTIQALNDFSKTYLETQMIITCRVAASDYSFSEFTYVEMADFSKTQVASYARNWFKKMPELTEDFLDQLNLTENKGIRDLGRSPLLLSMICLAYEETLSIPKRRVELYEEALDALLKKWDASRKIRRDQIYKKLSLGYKRQMFARIAAEYFDKGEIFFHEKHLAENIEIYLSSLPPDDLDTLPDGKIVLDSIIAQHGILVERAKGIYSFSHLTFQEYYVAKYIVDNASRGTLENLATHVDDSRWHEVFLLTASLLHDATPLFDAMKNSIQKMINADSKLERMHTWVVQRAGHTPDCKANVCRGVYWYILLSTARLSNSAISHSFAYKRTRALSRARSMAQASSRTPSRAYTSIKKPKLEDEILLARKNRNDAMEREKYYAQSIGGDLSRLNSLIHKIDIARDIAFNLVQFIDIGFESTLTKSIDFTRGFDTRFSNNIDHAKEFLRLNYKDLDQLSIDLALLNFNSLLNTFASAPHKGRSKSHVELLRDFIANWQSLLLKTKTPKIVSPSHKAHDEEWQRFRDNIQHVIEIFFEIPLDSTWDKFDYSPILSYLQANQLFRDCLQIARVGNREEVKTMIFREL